MWRKEEKGTTEGEMVGQCHWSNQHEFDSILGGSGRQEGLVCSGPWGHKESDTAKRLNNKQQQAVSGLGCLTYVSAQKAQEVGGGVPKKFSIKTLLYPLDVLDYNFYQPQTT